ncbi:Nif3-like dinuclear metal center hexameric protein [Ornithinibacillus scapharcae]|uniref:Nif3-like dinuclear metal center hexameric protein n=1 Tax=Ornithinibacillus scapharcae TaxID=1147159 RepID=UPI000225B395|nr:Nif3-like dinuclear metal center hexameric protein [Ornithinibacillus scapharcae]
MAQKIHNSDIFRIMEAWAPKSLAYDWDNVGLQVGSHNNPVKKIMVTLDVTEAVTDEAIKKDVDLIIAHHPLLFRPLKQINTDHFRGKIIQKLIQHDITVYAAHTNLDIASGGVNDMLADLLSLNNRKSLVDFQDEKLYKLAVFVPESHIQAITNALAKHGAGHLGNYSHCTFQTKGTGTFLPLEGAKPFIGEVHTVEHVNEIKVETIVQESILQNVVSGVINAHPYEEVAYDIIPLQNKGNQYGLGRIGTLEQPMSLKSFVQYVKEAFKIEHVRVSGNLDKKVKRIAVVGGSGEKYIQSALIQKADVYITGDVSFHFAQDAIEMGIPVIDAGHYIEQIMKSGTKEYLEDNLANLSFEIEVIESETNTDPFQYL